VFNHPIKATTPSEYPKDQRRDQGTVKLNQPGLLFKCLVELMIQGDVSVANGV
jgi:hypothetical protein